MRKTKEAERRADGRERERERERELPTFCSIANPSVFDIFLFLFLFLHVSCRILHGHFRNLTNQISHIKKQPHLALNFKPWKIGRVSLLQQGLVSLGHHSFKAPHVLEYQHIQNQNVLKHKIY